MAVPNVDTGGAVQHPAYPATGPAEGVAGAASKKPLIFRKGTLSYTRATLALLFFYLLWGDFCLQAVEIVVPSILPLQLKSLSASNTLIGILVTTMPFLINMTINPVVSFRSDNYRSRWGRRIPFLLFVTPFVTLLLVLIAFAPEIGRAFHNTGLAGWLGISAPTAVIVAIVFLLVLFQLFNFCLQPIYYYLFVDVVPDECMGRFMAFFRIVATLSGYLFNTFIYGHALTHTRYIYTGIAALYFIGFMAMCWGVREGDYPPPAHGARLGLKNSAKVYFRECYSHRHYLLFNARNAFWAMSNVCGVYYVFLYRDSLGISLDTIGKVSGWTNLITAILLYPMGMLSDKVKPIRIVLFAMILCCPLHLLNFFFLHDKASYIVLMMIGLPIYALIAASELPFYVSFPPKERYGQFGSANQIVCSLSIVLGGVVAGLFIDWATHNGTAMANYRWGYLWGFAFNGVSLIFMLFLYRSWKKHGGPDHYVPP